MMGVTRGYSAPLRKLDCQIAGGGDPPTMRMRMRNALAMTTAAFGLAGLSACSPYRTTCRRRPQRRILVQATPATSSRIGSR